MKRKMPPHIVLPNGMWRFVKRGTRSSKKTRKVVVKMAKKRKGGKRQGSYVGGFRIPGTSGLLKKFIPIAGGAVDHVAPPVMGVTGYASFILGWILKDNITCGIGGYQMGHSLVDAFGGGFGNSGGGGFQ